MELIIFSLFAFLITSATVPFLVPIATKLGIIDWPDARRIHTIPTPRIGGVAIFFGFHIACGLMFVLGNFPTFTNLNMIWWFRFLLASTVMVLVGLADDRKPIAPFSKLLGQVTAALIICGPNTHLGNVFGYNLPPMLDMLLTVFWIIIVTNSFNLIDGLDGLATSIGCISCLGLIGGLVYWGNISDIRVPIIFIFSCLGFLQYNKSPARIFLGDSGSNFIGLFLGTIMLANFEVANGPICMTASLLFIAIPVIDTFLAIWRRSARYVVSFLRNETISHGIMIADVEHLHHRLVATGMLQRNVTALLCLVNSVFVIFGLISIPFQIDVKTIVVAFVLIGICVIYRCSKFMHAELWYSGAAVMHGLVHPTKPKLAGSIFIIFDLLSFIIITLLILPLCSTFRHLEYFAHFSKVDMINWCLLPFIFLAYTEVFCRHYSLSNRLRLKLLLSAIIISLTINISPPFQKLLFKNEPDFFAYGAFSVITLCMVIGINLLPKITEILLRSGEACRLVQQRTKERTLIYGSEECCRKYILKETDTEFPGLFMDNVIGVVGDKLEPTLTQICGYIVLGKAEDLPHLIQTHAIGKIIVATELSLEIQQDLMKLATNQSLSIVALDEKCDILAHE